ncbi:MAG TPA: hypothetical protein VLV56_08635 [Burkholderiales bacterium]|nr:hypothetical protein [Burkholderiales bacterium]
MLIDTLIQVVIVAFLAWGGMLSLQCVIRSGGIGFPGGTLKAE